MRPIRMLCAALTLGLAAALPASAVRAQEPQPTQVHGTVVETRDASSYTYVQIEIAETEEKVWAAVPKMAIAVGAEVTLLDAIPMQEFYSPSFNMVFDTLYLATGVETAGGESLAPTPDAASAHASAGGAGLLGPCGSGTGEQIDLADIEPAEGGQTVAQLWQDRGALVGQQIRVRGRVVKCTSGVLGRNWIHLRDGTSAGEGQEDLTVTTEAGAEVGDTVVVMGTVAVNRDFGAGYRYDLLLENAKLSVE